MSTGEPTGGYRTMRGGEGRLRSGRRGLPGYEQAQNHDQGTAGYDQGYGQPPGYGQEPGYGQQPATDSKLVTDSSPATARDRGSGRTPARCPATVRRPAAGPATGPVAGRWSATGSARPVIPGSARTCRAAMAPTR